MTTTTTFSTDSIRLDFLLAWPRLAACMTHSSRRTSANNWRDIETETDEERMGKQGERWRLRRSAGDLEFTAADSNHSEIFPPTDW